MKTKPCARTPEEQLAFDVARIAVDASEELRAAMEAKGVTQAALARRLGRSASAVSRALSGDSPVRMDTLVRYARAVGCRVDVRVVKDDIS